VEGITKDLTARFLRGFPGSFPDEENYRRWKLLVQGTLEYLPLLTLPLSPMGEGWNKGNLNFSLMS